MAKWKQQSNSTPSERFHRRNRGKAVIPNTNIKDHTFSLLAGLWQSYFYGHKPRLLVKLYRHANVLTGELNAILRHFIKILDLIIYCSENDDVVKSLNENCLIVPYELWNIIFIRGSVGTLLKVWKMYDNKFGVVSFVMSLVER